MTQYRLYCLNEAGRFAKAHEIEAESDQQAINEARKLNLPVVCELWEHGRMVAKLEPFSALIPFHRARIAPFFRHPRQPHHRGPAPPSAERFAAWYRNCSRKPT
jgi:hypothetical protein